MKHDRTRITAILHRRDACAAASRDAAEKAREAMGRVTRRQADLESLKEQARAGFASEREAFAKRIAETEADLATLRADARQAQAVAEKAGAEWQEAGRLAEAVERHCRAAGIALPGEAPHHLAGMSYISQGVTTS